MHQLEELNEGNLEDQISSLLAGTTTSVDPAVAIWCREDKDSRLATVTDKRKLSKVDNHYDNICLMWSFINTRSDPDDDDWATVRQAELRRIVNKNSDLAEIKRLFDAQGWAEWEEGFPHRMRLNPTGEPVMVDLVHKSTDRILGEFTGKDTACETARHVLNHTEIIESEAKAIIREIYLGHIRRRDHLRENKGIFIPFTREEENKLRKLRTVDGYNGWIMGKSRRVSASIINPVRQIRSGKGAVFRVPKQNGHRLFSPFTFLKRELRRAVRLDGERLVSLDIRSCQPTLLANKTGDTALLNDCLENRFYGRVSEHLEEHSMHPFTPNLTHGGWTDEEAAEIEKNWPKYRTPVRDRAKMALMEYLFGPNQHEEKDEGKDQLLIQAFMFKSYPKTAQYVFDQKEKMFYGQVARDLQAAESKLFIDEFYYTDLRQAGIMGLTVHDAVYVKASDADKAEKAFKQRLKKVKMKAVLDRENY